MTGTGTTTETGMAEAEEDEMSTITREETVGETPIGTETMTPTAGTGNETGTVVTIDLVIGTLPRNVKLMDHPREVPKELMSMGHEVPRNTRVVLQVTATEATMTTTASLPGDSKLRSKLIFKMLPTVDVLLNLYVLLLQE